MELECCNPCLLSREIHLKTLCNNFRYKSEPKLSTLVCVYYIYSRFHVLELFSRFKIAASLFPFVLRRKKKIVNTQKGFSCTCPRRNFQFSVQQTNTSTNNTITILEVKSN